VSLLTNAVRVLNCFSEGERELRLSDISRRLGMSTSHTHRLLSVLVDEGLLRRGLRSPKYQLGLRLFELGRLAINELDPPLALPAMLELGQRTGETVLLSVRDQAHVIFVQRVDSPQTLHVSPPLDRRYPAWTAAGQSLLAWEDKAEIGYVIRQLFPVTLEDADAKAQQFQAALAATRQLGYALNDPGGGIRAIATPVRDGLGSVVAAISVAAPIQRLGRGRVPGTGKLVMRAAKDLSTQLATLPSRHDAAPRPSGRAFSSPDSD
jgi:IclR family transcriptional regulator, KDG regulon repressor